MASIGDGDNEELITSAIKGDATAFCALIDVYYPVIYRMAFRLIGNGTDAEDVTQMACMKIARNITSFKRDAAFTTWLYKLVLNVARDWGRSQKRHRADDIAERTDIGSEDQSAEEKLATAQRMARVRALPEPEREIVFLVFGEGLSHKQAADIMGCKESTISWRIHEARKILNAREVQAHG